MDCRGGYQVGGSRVGVKLNLECCAVRLLTQSYLPLKMKMKVEVEVNVVVRVFL
jgi:hypothetical protein